MVIDNNTIANEKLFWRFMFEIQRLIFVYRTSVEC